MNTHAVQDGVAEWSFTAERNHSDPTGGVTLDVVVSDPGGVQLRVPAFWAGGQEWRVRYASSRVGVHTWASDCSDTSDAGLHGVEGEIEVRACTADRPLLGRGALRVSKSRRFLEYADGKPFFWLGDTWWMGLCSRLSWPEDFKQLAADRVQKGFTVVQIVAGPYPDMDSFDPRGENEAGFPWTEEYSSLNPAYYDMADRRIRHLVEAGLVPCILGCWGYYLQKMGAEKIRQHWRNLIARYGAYPVVWCLAGEGSMPYYLSGTKEEDREALREGWTEIARYVREVDPFGRLLTIHPSRSARQTVNDASVLDLDMLQTGHGDRTSIPNTLRLAQSAYGTEPVMPVINSEVCYEGIGEACRQEVQRMMFWICVLSGACGHTYGANGIWQVNRKDAPYGPSPGGTAWGHTPWDVAAQLPGSTQLGLAKDLLERYAWWAFDPHPEWVAEHATAQKVNAPYAGGIPGQVRVIFLPSDVWGITVKGLDDGVTYSAYIHSPVDGSEVLLGAVKPDADGDWRLPEPMPIFQDWVLVLEAEGARA